MPKKILIAEDEFFLAETIGLRLESLGYEVQYAENGQEALTLMQAQRPDLVLMDCLMPVMDGFEAIRHMRLEPTLKTIPVICLTALARPEDRTKAEQAGANDYMTKPFEMHELAKKIEQCLL